jgi:hypothetical protein
MPDDKITVTVDGVTREVSGDCVTFTPTIEYMTEIVGKIAAELDAMSPEERAEHESTRRLSDNQADQDLLAALSPEERQRVLEIREAFHDRLQAPKPHHPAP